MTNSCICGTEILQELQHIREELTKFRQEVVDAIKVNNCSELIIEKPLAQPVSLEKGHLQHNVSIIPKEAFANKRKSNVNNEDDKKRLKSQTKKKAVCDTKILQSTKKKQLSDDTYDTKKKFSFKTDDITVPVENEAFKTPLDKKEFLFMPEHKFLEGLFSHSDTKCASSSLRKKKS